MLKSIKLLFCLTVMLACLQSCNDDETKTLEFDKQTMINGFVDQVDASFNNFNTELEKLNQLVGQLNDQTSISEFETTQNQFRELSKSFQSLRVFDIGPLKSNLYLSRMSQWPSKTNDILEIIEGDEVLGTNFINSLGANLKGLFGIEFLLFEAQKTQQDVLSLFTTGENAERRIEFIKLILRELQQVFDSMQSNWNDEYKAVFLVATENGVNGAQNRLYNQSVTVLDELLNSIRFPNDNYDIDGDIPNSDNLIFWNSQYTKESMLAAILALEAIYQNGGSPGFFDHLNFVNAKWEDETLIADALQNSFNSIEDILSEMESIESDILNNNERIENLVQTLKDLLVYYKTDMPSWLSLLLLVGDNDGD